MIVLYCYTDQMVKMDKDEECLVFGAYFVDVEEFVNWWNSKKNSIRIINFIIEDSSYD